LLIASAKLRKSGEKAFPFVGRIYRFRDQFSGIVSFYFEPDGHCSCFVCEITANQSTNYNMKKIIYSSLRKLRTVAISLLIAGILLPALASAQDLTIVSPNGGENWLQGTTATITWTNTGQPGDLMLEYTEDGGIYWYSLAYIPADDTSSSFTFQNYFYATTQAKVRVSYYADPTNNDESDGFFTVTEPPVYFYSPYYGDSYYRTQPVYISWYSYTIGTFNLEYSLDNGSSWTAIVNDYTGFDYTWNTPDQVSDAAIIRISDATDPNSYGLSPTFSIVEIPVITVTSPNGGETWTYGQVADVSWTGSNLPYYLYIDYSPDGGLTWINVGSGYSEPNGGTSQVYVPYDGTDNALVKIYDPYYPEASDESDNVFTIYVPPVIVNNPYQGAQYYNTSDIYTSWITSGVDLLKIEISPDNGQTWTTVAENVEAALGYFTFTLNTTPSENAVLRLSDMSDPSKFGLSQVFTVLEAPVITLTSPLGGEIFNTESYVTISWLYDNQSSYYIYLEYSTDNGQTWNYISYVPNDLGGGSYIWYTPVVNSQECLIRVTDYYLGFVEDISNPFTIITFPQTPICMVTVDSTTNRNVIMWDKPASELIDRFVVYKESNQANVYEVLATINYDEPAMVMDTNSNPAIKSYRYKLGFLDAEGNVFPMSDFHQTMHLTINQGVGNTWNLIWSSYLGFEVPSYNIYRKTAATDFEQIASISSSFNSYSDVNAPAGDVYYMVEVVNPNGCNIAAREFYASSFSNVATNNTLGVNDGQQALNVSVYPNPADRQINVVAGQDLKGNVRIILNDLLGKEVYNAQVSDLRPGMKQTINSEDLKEGIYILKVSSDKVSFTGKVIVNH
jgi:hypothetical protein